MSIGTMIIKNVSSLCSSDVKFFVSEVSVTESAYGKGRALLEAGCTFSEFGTRRRRSYHTQDLVVRALAQAFRDAPGKGRFSGTSNVRLLRYESLRGKVD